MGENGKQLIMQEADIATRYLHALKSYCSALNETEV